MEFELIERQIQKFKHLSFVPLIFDQLLLIERNPKYLYPFWRLLVILKWSFTYSTDKKYKKSANKFDLDRLIELTEQFESEYGKISLKDHKSVQQFFRIIAYQQFAYQDHYSNSVINRQLVLFCKLNWGSLNIQEEFKKLTGITIINFFNYSYTTYLYLHFEALAHGTRYNGRLNDDFFTYFKEKYFQEELNTFLNLLSIKNNNDFDELHRLKKEILQLYETNFFVTKPFIYFKDEYRIPHRAVFLQTVTHFVYNYLKRNWPQFPDQFGYVLEQYVGLGLHECKQSFKKEVQLNTEYKLKKVTDFLIEPDILIEVKATELHPRSGVSRESETLQDDLKTSIVKAYTQLLSTANSIDNKRIWYGIIITYKEMYLGFGPDAWDEFLKEPIEGFLISNAINQSILPPENLFFVSISDWDWIVQILKEKKTINLKSILDKSKECSTSSDPYEKVFMIEQVLRKYFYVRQFNLSFHQEAHKLLDVLPSDISE